MKLIPWAEYFAATGRWPAVKTARETLFDILTPKQIAEYQERGTITVQTKTKKLLIAYGQHFNVCSEQDGRSWCTLLLTGYSSSVEHTLLAQVLIIRNSFTEFAKYAGGIHRASGLSESVGFAYAQGRMVISGQYAFPWACEHACSIYLSSGAIESYMYLTEKYKEDKHMTDN